MVGQLVRQNGDEAIDPGLFGPQGKPRPAERAPALVDVTIHPFGSGALALLAQREKYLAFEEPARRYDVGARYGLLIAQLALVLSGQDRDEVLTRILELLARRELSVTAGR